MNNFNKPTQLDNTELLKKSMRCIVTSTNHGPTVDKMRKILEQGGRELLNDDPDFKKELIEDILRNENLYVVIYEDLQKAECFLDLYRLLE